MITKKQVQFIQSLNRKKERINSKLFVIEGKKMVEELMKQKNDKCKELFTTDQEFAKTYDGVVIDEKQMKQISNQKTPSGYLALVQFSDNKALPQKGKVIVLDQINDPGNLGTIIRIADWFGFDAIVASEDTVDCYNPKVVQSTMGSILRIPVIYSDLTQFLEKWEYPALGMLLEGSPLSKRPKINDFVVIIGSESHGIDEKYFPFITDRVKIEGRGAAESLNAAISSAIVAYALTHE